MTMLRLRLSLLVAFVASAGLSVAQPTARLEADLSRKGEPMEINRYGLSIGGFTDQNPWATRMDELKVLRPRLIRLFVQEYYDLLSDDGKYYFDELDRSVDLIRETGAEPVLCITFKPKRLFPRIDNELVEPTSWEAWQELVQAVVSHYKNRGGRIPYWEVANEPNLESGGGTPYHFTPESYYRYYKYTAAAVRKVDPAAKVGGPALAGGFREDGKAIAEHLLARCVKDGTPIDFLSWHGYNNDARWFGESTKVAHEMIANHPGLKLETMINEWNVSLREMNDDPQFQPAFLLEATYGMKKAGLSYSNYYHIRDTFFFPELFLPFYEKKYVDAQLFFWNYRPQPLGLFDLQDRVRPAYFAFKLLARLTGEEIEVNSSDENVRGLATYDADIDAYNLLVWNYSARPIRAEIALRNLTKKLAGPHQRLDGRAPSDDDIHRIRLLGEVVVDDAAATLVTDFEAYGIQHWTLH